MTTPLALLLACFAVVPWILHRLKRSPTRTVRLPTLALLERSVASSRRARRFADWMLLGIRTLLLLTIALAATDLYRQAHLPFSPNVRTHLVLVIDDSLSMSVRVRGRTRFDKALTRARELLGALNAASSATVITTAPARALLVRLPADRALEQLDTLKVALGEGDLHAAIERAREQASRDASARIVVLSDLAGTRDADLDADGIDIEAMALSTDRVDDTAIVDVRLQTSTHGPTARIALQSTARVRAALTARWTTGRAERDLDIAPGASETSLDLNGYDGHALIDFSLDIKDAIEFDNALRAGPPQQDVVLIVASSREASEPLARAIDALDGRSPIEARWVDATTLDEPRLNQARWLFVADGVELGELQARATIAWVRRGGALVFCAGDGGDARRASERLEPALGAFAVSVRDDEARVRSSSTPSIDGLALRRFARIETNGASALAQLDASAALTARDVDQGHAMMLAFPLSDQWSDVAVSARYVGLVAALLDASASHSRHRLSLRVHGPVELPANAARAMIDDGTAPRPLTPDMRGRVLLRPRRFGSHRIVSTDGDEEMGRVDVLPATSELALLPSRLRSSRSTKSTNLERVSLSPWVWLLVAVLVVIEALVREASVVSAGATRSPPRARFDPDRREWT